ncbi:serine threonine protein kinase [Leptolyngbya sp. Heron Island J]|uniref:protein kinase domain-containing protein n=1 Tax=Leptolyngbya sp. Heron Island J TaxID=1385935 RepID=UPI0003B9B6B1|nr:tetratricopeptide repeat protein [Leptolyngbya sp. Heron Island J]ESA36879.1 serine threonine protein kinase [Leptolyngbya sp. Heron Island J]
MNLMQLLGVKSKQTLGGRYKLIQPLGQGGFGHTFLATDLHLPDHPTCVIKQLKPHLQDTASLNTARRLFETEARVLYQLGEHDQIPRLLAHFEDGQEFYLAQELIEGDSLSDVIRSGQLWSEARVRHLLTEILTPLAFVHEQGVIHRDLKPSNLIHRRADGHMVLIDFGAVKQVSENRNNGEVTRTISIGTQGYMPNEQLAGNPWFSSDIYAAGMIALQALTGTSPHLLKRDVRTSEVLWQSPDLELSDGFQTVLSRMVRYDYRDRYATAADVLAALQSLPAIASEPIATRSTSLPTQVVAPASPSQNEPSQHEIDTAPLPSSPTVAAEKLGLPVVTQSLQTLTKATAAVPSMLAHNRRSLLGLSVVTVVALGLVRNSQTSANLFSQPAAIPNVELSSSESANTTTTPAADSAPEPTAAAPPTETSAEPTSETSTESPTATPAEPSATNAPPTAAAPKPNVDELLAKADQLRDRNQYQEAIQTYTQLLEQNPDQVAGHWGQCYSLNQLHNYGQAIAACDRALAIAPDNPQALWSKGYALEQQGQPQAALALYDQTLALDPDYTEAWNNRGGILLKQQRFQEAFDAFDHARKLDPDFAQAWSNRGAALWGLRRFDDAISSIDKAIELQPDYPEAQALREQIRQKLGR